MQEYNVKLITESGEEYYGYSFGAVKECITEIVFNTSPVGYQEIISDPSYTNQTVVMAYPLIGNYGCADDDYERDNLTIGGLAVRDYNDSPSNFRSTATLGEVMKKYGIPGISGIDTRKLVRSIRDKGSGLALICSPDVTLEDGLKKIKEYIVPHNAVSEVSRKCEIKEDAGNARFNVVAIDCGMKQSIVKRMTEKGCKVTVVPYNTPAEEIEKKHPDGIFISNGPGDPTDVTEVIETVRKLKGKYPIFGICLGHQIIALAYGAKTYKLKFGHRGGNHPVKNLKTGKTEITSQNHSYAVDAESLGKTPLSITHINLLDGTVEGLECEKDRIFSVQYHPESAPGPEDSTYLFDRFVRLMEDTENAEEN